MNWHYFHHDPVAVGHPDPDVVAHPLDPLNASGRDCFLLCHRLIFENVGTIVPCLKLPVSRVNFDIGWVAPGIGWVARAENMVDGRRSLMTEETAHYPEAEGTYFVAN